ncbi:spermidine synthase [Pseudomonas sp. ES3]|jgi:spermidine synthase
MGCTGFLGDPSKDRISVLMLGLSDGVALAPIAASTRVASLLAVDLDETAFSRSLDNRNRLAANTDFDSVVADAAHFLDVTPDRYDVIIVDLYTQTGYAPIVFDHGFHQLLKSRLNPLGHVVFNGFGVPMNLDPFNGPTPQAWLAHCLNDSWGDIHYLPHRRNATFIIGPPPSITPRTAPTLESLCASDRLFMEIMRLRLRYLIPTVIRQATLVPPALDFVGIDLEVQKRWMDSLPALSALLPASLKLRKPNDLRVLLDDPDACQALQERLVKDKSSLHTTLALLVAGEVNFSDRDMSWLPDWVVSTLENSVEIYPRDWLEGLLPYAYGVITHRTRGDATKVEGFRRALARLSPST